MATDTTATAISSSNTPLNYARQLLKSPPRQLLYASQLTGGLALAGFTGGFYLGVVRRSSQFLAEHAHRLPRTVAGWFFYHRRKNHACILAGVGNGLRYSRSAAAVAALLASSELSLEHFSDAESGLNVVVGWTASSLVLTRILKLNRSASLHLVRHALVASMAVALLEDSYSYFTHVSAKYPGTPRPRVFPSAIGWNW